jgi:hypothetical protein
MGASNSIDKGKSKDASNSTGASNSIDKGMSMGAKPPI